MKKLFVLKLLIICFAGTAASQTVVTLALPDPCRFTNSNDYLPQELSFNFSVYPNPAEDKLIIDIQSAESIGEVHIQLINLNGKVVMFESIYSDNPSGIKPLDVSSLPPGLYLVAIYRGLESLNKKIVIQ